MLLTMLEGYTVSVLAHVIVIGMLVIPKPARTVTEEVPEAFRWAEFLLPKDRPPGSQPVRETISYVGLPAPGGAGQLAVEALKEPERLEIVKEEGLKTDDILDVAVAPTPAPEIRTDTIMTVLEVDTAAARYEDSAAPPYPESMLRRKLEGTVAVQYVVDTTGRADTASFVVLSTTHSDFAKSVRATLPAMRFRPAFMGARKVRQLVQQLFTFKIDTLTPTKKGAL
jgi:TonB family protein